MEGEATEVRALLAALDARDPFTGRHARSVLTLARDTAWHMGLPSDEVDEVGRVAALHDVGKLATPDRVLLKPGPLDDLERAVMRDHAAAGARIVAQIASVAHLAAAVRAVHERWDGHGYPDRLYGGMIPLPSRIVFACDAYDAMTSARPYRSALGHNLAVAELRRGAGTQFCARTVESLLDVLAGEDRRALAAGAGA